MKKTIALAVVGIVFAVLLFTAWYNSEDNKMRRNGFEIREHSAGPIDTAYHLNLTKTDLESLNTLQIYAHNLGVTTIWSNTYRINETSGIGSYYFITGNYLYYTQFPIMIYDNPYPTDIMFPTFVVIGIAAVIIFGVLSIMYIRKFPLVSDN